MIPLAKSGDQRSAKKEKTKRDKICGREKFLEDSETEYENERSRSGW